VVLVPPADHQGPPPAAAARGDYGPKKLIRSQRCAFG
jgi:hypothetical protein